MRKALITGISGFAGSFLAEHLVSKDVAEVSGIYNNEASISNLENIIILSARRLNVYSVASSPKIFLTTSAYEHLITRLKLI